MAQKVIFELVVEDAGLTARIEQARQTIRNLNKEIRANPGPERFAELTTELSKNRRELSELTKQQKALNRELESLKVPKDSLAGLRFEYGKLSQAVSQLSAAERQSPFGKNLINNAAKVKKEIDGIEQSIGRFTGNVGNYQSALSGLGQAFAAVGVGFSINEIIGANTKISDSIADVAKTAGITTSEAQRLADTLEFRDTRTSLADQLQIAQIGGQLGVAANQLQGFTKSVDVLNVSLGDQFGNVDEITRVIAGLRNVLTDFRTDDVSGDILKLGNALNYLEAKGNATAPTIAEFVNRLSGTAVPLGVSTDQIFGLSTALAELSINPERGATAISGLLIEISRAPEVFAKSLNLPVKEFSDLVNTDLVGALTLVSKKVAEGGDGTKNFAQILDEVGIGRQGAIEALGKLGGKVELVTKRITESGAALQATDSVYAEFDKKNNNAAAAVEKLRNAFINFIASEGAQDAIEAVAGALTNLVGVFSSVAEVVSDNSTEFAALAAAIFAMKNPTALAVAEFIKLQAAQLRTIATTEANAVAQVEGAAATNAANVATKGATIATQALGAAQAAWPLLAIIAGVYAIVKALEAYNNSLSAAEKATNAVSDAQEEIAQSSAKEITALNAAIGTIRDSAASQQERAKAIAELNSQYPEYLKGLNLETASAEQLTVIQRELTDEIIRGAAARAKANATAEVTSKIVQQTLKVEELVSKRESGTKVLTIGAATVGLDKVIEGERQRLADLRSELEATGKKFDEVFKLKEAPKSAVIDIVDPKSLKAQTDLAKLSIAELEKLGTDAAKKEIARRKAANDIIGGNDKKAVDKTKADRQKAADDEEKAVTDQLRRISDIQKSVRDLQLGDETGFDAKLRAIENARIDALEKNALRLVDLRARLKQETGVEVKAGATGAEIVNQVPNAKPATITEANLIDAETTALKASFDRQRDELRSQRDQTAADQQAQLEKLLAETSRLAAENEAKAAESAQAAIENSFDDRSEALRRSFDERNALLSEALAKGQITQGEYDVRSTANAVELNNRNLQLEQEHLARVTEVVNQVRDVKIAAAQAALDEQLLAIRQQQEADIADVTKQGKDTGTDTTTRVSAINEQAAADAEAAQIEFANTVQQTTRDAELAQLDAVQSVREAKRQASEAEIEEIKRIEELRKQLRNAALDTAGQVADGIIQIQKNKNQERTEEELAELDEQYASKINAAQGNAALEAQLQKELAAKKEKIQKDSAKKDQNLAIIGAVINTAIAVTKALSATPYPPINFAFAALAAAAGAIQIAVIKSQPLAEGGFLDDAQPGQAKPGHSGPRPSVKGKTLSYPKKIYEALPDLSGRGGFTGGGIGYRDATGHRVAGKLSGSNAVVHAGEYVAPAHQVAEHPELFAELDRARKQVVKPFAEGGFTRVNYGNFTHLKPFAQGGFADPIIGLPTAAQFQAQTVSVQANASFSDQQTTQIGAIIAAEIAKQIQPALANGLNDANRRLEREASLEQQRTV